MEIGRLLAAKHIFFTSYLVFYVVLFYVDAMPARETLVTVQTVMEANPLIAPDSQR
jgi:hypothetical protein